MRARKGYLILEHIVSMAITGIILTTLYGLFFTSLNIYSKIHSIIEIQQQGLEIQNHIEKELSDNIEIKSIKTVNNQNITDEEFSEKDVISIKYKPIDRDAAKGLDEIYINNRSNKVFIKRKDATSGHEIGDYINNIYIEKVNSGKIINIRLNLSKGSQKHEIKFSL